MGLSGITDHEWDNRVLTRYRLDPDPPEAIFKALCERPQVFEEFLAFRAINDSKRRESRRCLTNRDRVRVDAVYPEYIPPASTMITSRPSTTRNKLPHWPNAMI